MKNYQQSLEFTDICKNVNNSIQRLFLVNKMYSDTFVSPKSATSDISYAAS